MASEREEVCVFPKLYFGDLQGSRSGKAGTEKPYGYIALSAETLLWMIRGICDEIGRNGLKKILIFSGHGGFGESAMLMGTYPDLIRLDLCEKEDGLNQHVSDPITSLGVQWAGIWNTDCPNAYCGHPPIGLTQAIVDAAVEISVQRLVEALKVLKDDSVMDPIIGASRKSWAKD